VAILVGKGVVTEAEIRDDIAHRDSRSPANGARLVARAGADGGFRTELLADGNAAAVELGIDAVASTDLVVVENTPGVHDLIVCTPLPPA
jgi:nitrile hydratase